MAEMAELPATVLYILTLRFKLMYLTVFNK